MTASHSAAVARYARDLAREIGMDPQQEANIYKGGLLHDIGKFVFPDSILFASRRLTPAEWEIVRSHTIQGAMLVARIEGYADVAKIVEAHHERIDGQGYPYGLPADEIPLGARVIAVCDTYDVMTARNTHRSPVARQEAIAELRRVSGTQLDAAIVETFIPLVAVSGQS